MSDKKIRIEAGGPYVVTGGVPLTEKIIQPEGKGYVYKEGRTFETEDCYRLCRCGKSKTPPFCDGAHEHVDFDGFETASPRKFEDRLTNVVEGPTLDLLDDGRCAYARFCHRQEGVAWNLVKKSDDPHLREEAIAAAVECPAGRLVVRDKDGNILEPALEPSIEILQDPQEDCSGPLYVKGGIPIESADGFVYEVRNRVTLCRCGESYNMPFCDASHVRRHFNDGFIQKKKWRQP